MKPPNAGPILIPNPANVSITPYNKAEFNILYFIAVQSVLLKYELLHTTCKAIHMTLMHDSLPILFAKGIEI